jgi:hypothetical protein
VPAEKKSVGKTLLTITILNVAAKLLATEFIATTCSDFFSVGTTLFCNNFIHLPTTFVAAKNFLSCSDS